MWFTCKIKYDKVSEEGLLKKESETYMVDALSFTEAEERFIAEMEPFMSGDFEVTDIKKTKVAELLESEDTQADKWYKANVALITLDEKTAKEKKQNCPMFVQATDFKDAMNRLYQFMASTLGDYTLTSLAETPIMDVYHVSSSEKNENA